MAIGRNIRVYGRYIKDESYHLLVEQRGQDHCLIIYNNNTIQTIDNNQFLAIK